MSTNKKPTPKKNAKKTAPTKAAPKKQAPKAKNGPTQKSSAPAKASQLKPNAKDGDGDGFIQDGSEHERRKPGRPKKKSNADEGAATDKAPVVRQTVNIQSTGLEMPYATTTTTASGSIPPIPSPAMWSTPKTTKSSSPQPSPKKNEKKGFFRRFFGRNK